MTSLLFGIDSNDALGRENALPLKLKRQLVCPKEDAGCKKTASLQMAYYRLVPIEQGIKNFKPIDCSSGSSNYSSTYQCEPLLLSDGSFYVIDCFGHDAVDQDCYIRLFDKNGRPIQKFDPNFSTSHSEAMGDRIPKKGAIKDILSASVAPGGLLVVEGKFQIFEVDQLSDFERHFCIDEDCVGHSGLSTVARIQVDQTGKIIQSKILNLAKLPYTKEQILSSIRNEIPQLETYLSKRLPNETDEQYQSRQSQGHKQLDELKSQLKKYSGR